LPVRGACALMGHASRSLHPRETQPGGKNRPGTAAALSKLFLNISDQTSKSLFG
jgi:hypothetical protein